MKLKTQHLCIFLFGDESSKDIISLCKGSYIAMHKLHLTFFAPKVNPTQRGTAQNLENNNNDSENQD